MSEGRVERSWRVDFHVEIEVTASNDEAARLAAREILGRGCYDMEQASIEEVYEVDPLTGVWL